MTIHRALTYAACVALFSSPIFAQSPSAAAATPAAATTPAAPLPAFQLADVHSSPHVNSPSIRGGTLHGDRYTTSQATMTNLIARSYNVESRNVLGGPPWLDLDRFDVVAQAPRTTSPDDIRLMLRSMLIDRFKLAVHPGTKPLPAFVLTVGKAAKIKPSDASSKPDPSDASASDDQIIDGCQYHPPPPNTPLVEIRFTCHAITMESFANFLHDLASPYLKQPVVDQTGLKGTWDFDIHWTYQPPKADAPGTTIFDAVSNQLGLKLEAGTAPLPVVFVDSVRETPTPNAPGLDKALPPPPPATFDVAVIKPASPDEKGITLRINGSQIIINNAPLDFLITWSWDINDDRIANAPDFLNKDHWDILGKVNVDTTPIGPGSAPQIDQDDLQQMLKTLLADRFGLKSHTEDRPVDGYTLVAAGPHLKPADPANRTGCKTGPGPDGKDPRIDNPQLGRLVTCLNITMAQFAAQLQTMASGYIKSPVIDATGISGAYDFTLSFSTAGQLRTPSPQAAGDDPAAASLPPGGISLFDAINKTLGVKLEKTKVPIPTLVLDHIDRTPTEN
ncbi:MAG: TIGR03435 family protein [Acidobacteriaceae bacterium]|jgi:uncharacterized protein (TIGR03435 family)